jgi:hypothetical protein
MAASVKMMSRTFTKHRMVQFHSVFVLQLMVVVTTVITLEVLLLGVSELRMGSVVLVS